MLDFDVLDTDFGLDRCSLLGLGGGLGGDLEGKMG